MKRESGEIPLDMGQATKAGRGGRGSKSGQDGKGCRGCDSTMSRSVPSTVSEVGACKDIEGKMFTIGSGNKGMDEEMLRTSMEKMALYICTEFGAEAAQEWTSGKQTVLKEPAYSQVVLAMHAERVKATKDRLNRKLTSLRDERLEIEGEPSADPGNHNLRKEMREVEDNIAKTKIELTDEIDLKLADNEMAAHNSAWVTYQESSESLMNSRGIVYSLLRGQCTQVLLNEMEQDVDWAMISGSSDPNLLFELIKRIVLKQSDNQYKPSVVDVAEQECLAQTYTNNSNADTQSTGAESVTLQGVQRDNVDASPSSEVRCTYLEACEEDAQTKYKGNTKVYPFPTPMKECKPIKLSGSGRSALKQSDNHNKMEVLVAEQQLATELRQEDQVSKTAHYGQSTKKVEIACQAGVCYHSSDLLHDKTTRPRMGDQESLSSTGKKLVVDAAEQECLAQSKSVLQGVQMDNSDVFPSSEMSYTHFEACEEDRKASYKEVSNDSKESTEVYLSETHKAQTLLNECKPIKLGVSAVAVQAKGYVTGGKHGKGKRGTQEYLPDEGWDALSADASPKPIESQKKCSSDKCDESVLSAMKANTNEKDKGQSHSQDALGRPKENLKIVLALKHGTCDKVDTAFVVPCSGKALPKLLSDIEVFNKQQISGAVRVREKQG